MIFVIFHVIRHLTKFGKHDHLAELAHKVRTKSLSDSARACRYRILCICSVLTCTKNNKLLRCFLLLGFFYSNSLGCIKVAASGPKVAPRWASPAPGRFKLAPRAPKVAQTSKGSPAREAVRAHPLLHLSSLGPFGPLWTTLDHFMPLWAKNGPEWPN